MDFISLLNVIATLFALMIVGAVASKLNIIDEVSSKRLSKLIINIGQPFLLISSLINVEYTPDNLILGLKSLGLGFVVHGVMALVAYLACFRIKNIDERKLSEFAMIFGNVGFIGFPILDSLFGARGLFMGAFYIASFNIIVWIWGIIILSRQRSDIKLTLKKALLNFGTVPSAIGFVLFLLNLNMPDFVYSSASYLASLCTPISVLITGALLARRKFAEIFLSAKMYYISFVKLIVMPLLVCVITKLVGFSSDWILFLTAVSAMPCAAVISMLSELYDIRPEYAANSVGTSSLLSIATMPCVLWIAQKIVSL
ncbi:MAG: AEC family transporter [Ruminococcaceae bacterium]|nr:AEC family transporter [Oscillospiraceae bacterium]